MKAMPAWLKSGRVLIGLTIILFIVLCADLRAVPGSE